MNKVAKKILCIILASNMLIATAFAFTGNDVMRKSIVDSPNVENVEIVLYSENLSEQKVEYIKQTLLNGGTPSDIESIFCIFGHDLETATVWRQLQLQ